MHAKQKAKEIVFKREEIFKPIFEGVKGGYHHCFSWGKAEGRNDWHNLWSWGKTQKHLLSFTNENIRTNGLPEKCLIYAILENVCTNTLGAILLEGTHNVDQIPLLWDQRVPECGIIWFILSNTKNGIIEFDINSIKPSYW